MIDALQPPPRGAGTPSPFNSASMLRTVTIPAALILSTMGDIFVKGFQPERLGFATRKYSDIGRQCKTASDLAFCVVIAEK